MVYRGSHAFTIYTSHNLDVMSFSKGIKIIVAKKTLISKILYIVCT